MDLTKHHFPIQWQILQTNRRRSNGFAHCSSACRRNNEHVKDQALTKINVQNKPIVLWPYVDDIFVVFNDMSALDIFFNTLNSVHNNITFTKELECGDSLAFLNVLIEKTQSGIQTTTYRKPTHLASTRIGQVSFQTTKKEILCLDYLTGLIKSPAHIIPCTVNS